MTVGAPVFVFDIETIPDVEAGRRLHKLPDDLADDQVVAAMTAHNLEKKGHDFLPHYLQQIVAISAVLRYQGGIKVWTLGEVDASEAEIIQRFYAGLEKFTPILVSWNGSGFDLPVLHYRSLKQSVSAPLYWETGENNQHFRWNNYINRYHERHLDLMDVMAGYQARANAPLNDIAVMLGFPGKLDMDGGKVWDNYREGKLTSIRDYCETDVLNTYLVYLRFELMRGHLTEVEYQQECEALRDYLKQENKPHFNEFLGAWQ